MNKSTQTVSLSIDPSGFMNAMKSGFESHISIIKELAQNSRRAGATAINIEINHESNSLTIVDDGKGIDDFSKLIGAYKSNWGENLNAESPYGIGFLSCILAADHITVKSNGFLLSANCEDIRSFKPIGINHIEPDGKTSITLVGDQLKPIFEANFGEIFAGFPVPVFINGLEIQRIHALDSGLVFNESVSGKICVPRLWKSLAGENQLAYTERVTCYYQGFQILTFGFEVKSNVTNVIHLDYTRYKAIAPDRHKLINEDNCKSEIKSTIQQFIRSDIHKVFDELGEEVILNAYHTLHYYKCLDILNNINRIPKDVLRLYKQYPIINANRGPTDNEAIKPAVHYSRQEIVEKKIPIFRHENFGDYDEDFSTAMYAYEMGGGYLDEPLDKHHWIYTLAINPDHKVIHCEIVNERKPSISQMDNGADHNAVFCDECILDGPMGKISIKSCALIDGQIVIPGNSSNSDVVLQSKDFTDEFGAFYQSNYDDDSQAFSDWLVAARLSDDPDALLKQVLASKIGNYPILRNKIFSVGIDMEGEIFVSHEQFPVADNLLPALKEPAEVNSKYAESIIQNQPDLYDAIELHGVRNINDDSSEEGTHFVVDDESPEQFSVYLHCKEGGLECVGDFTDYSKATAYAEELSQEYNWKIGIFTEPQ